MLFKGKKNKPHLVRYYYFSFPFFIWIFLAEKNISPHRPVLLEILYFGYLIAL